MNYKVSKCLSFAFFLLMIFSNRGATEQFHCIQDSLIKIVFIELLNYDGSYDHPIEVQIQIDGKQPYSRQAIPRLGEYSWKLELRDSTMLRNCCITPKLTGCKLTLDSEPIFRIIEGDCIGELVFRIMKIWQLEVDSKPRNVRVEIDDDDWYTRFTTDTLDWHEEQSMKIFINDRKSFVKKNVKADDLVDKKVIKLNKEKMRELIEIPERPNGFLDQLFRAQIDVEEVVLKMINP